jgi:hypothetical protein
MKHFTTVALVALVVVSITNGDFANPSILDIIKFVVIGVGIVLQILVWRKERAS